MRRALRLAEKSVGLASPNPTVGCVVVKDGKVVGEGSHRYSLLDHAEIRALGEARGLAIGATVYVTLEPCCRTGRTPPCAKALVEAGVRRVVVAMLDPNPEVSGRGVEFLLSAGIDVETGLLEGTAARLNEPFACYITRARPLIVGKVGMSLDGKIATSGGDARWITSREAREFGQNLRFRLDAILVGVGTILADDPQLTYRGNRLKDRALVPVILDSGLRTPPAARVLRDRSTSAPLIFCEVGVPAGRRNRLERAGAEVIPVRRGTGGLSLKQVVDELADRKVLGLLVEGGGEIHGSFLRSKLVDKFYFIVAPLVLGGRSAVPAVGGRGFEKISSAPRFRIVRTFRLGPDVVLESYPSYSGSMISPWLSAGVAPSASPGSRKP